MTVKQWDRRLRLGVNIDHVATIRNARGGATPDPVRAARAAMAAGADSVVMHLREDRRHISDDDLARMTTEVDALINLEMAATEEMVDIAVRFLPGGVCLVPEKREERTAEGGLDVVRGHNTLKQAVDRLLATGQRLSVFIEPEAAQLDAAASLGVRVVELHTGAYCLASGAAQARELARIAAAAAHGAARGMEVHAGHGLTFDTVAPVAAIGDIDELNIGHFLIGEAIFGGLDSTIKRMRAVMDQARAAGTGAVPA